MLLRDKTELLHKLDDEAFVPDNVMAFICTTTNYFEQLFQSSDFNF
jgi:hypothetical protein